MFNRYGFSALDKISKYAERGWRIARKGEDDVSVERYDLITPDGYVFPGQYLGYTEQSICPICRQMEQENNFNENDCFCPGHTKKREREIRSAFNLMKLLSKVSPEDLVDRGIVLE